VTSESLADLHTALIDARDGYAKALEKTHDPDALRYFRIMDTLHAVAHAEIHRMLAARGEDIDEDGSLMGAVHKAVVSVRSAVIGLDEGFFSAFASGEENNLKTYDQAIRIEQNAADRQTLLRHRDALAEKVAEMKQVAERKSR
jgi:uncharacterized protein (TIGR02284 family)